MDRSSKIRTLYRAGREKMYRLATVISPRLNTVMRYRKEFGRRPDLDRPESFEEKLLWLKLERYMDDPLVIQCADKYRVREYVQAQGCGHTLNELIGVWESPRQIPWEELPEKFVLKWNFGAGMNILCTDKAALDREATVEQLTAWGKTRPWLDFSEMQYARIPKRIICERFLECEAGRSIPDYKLYCFHGEPKAILVMHDRSEGTVKTEFFDADWKRLDNSAKYTSPEQQTRRPACLAEMLDCARKLSEPFPFVRCDLYVVGDRVYFGELTFTPAGGLFTSQTKVDGKDMTELLHIG